MAEVLGAVASGLALAGLLKSCLEAFEIIQVVRKQTNDFEKLCLRLNIERARLYTWGQTMDLIGDGAQQKSSKLRASPFEGLVTDALRTILALFEDGNRLRKRYGCSSSAVHVASNELATTAAHSTLSFFSVEIFAQSFGNFGLEGKLPSQMTRLAARVRWVVEDRTKFSELIQEIRGLIDGLQDITKTISTVARQEGVLRYSVQQIRDPDTLSLLTEICQEDYPDVSDAASTKLDIMTLSTHKVEAIEVWMNSTDGKPVDAENDLESMSIAELQQLVRSLTVRYSFRGSFSGNSYYNDILQEKDKLIKEQEVRIQRQDAVILDLQDQIQNHLSSLQLPAITGKPDPQDPSRLRTSPGQMSSPASAPSTSTPESAPSVETFKSFRVALEDPTWKVLPAALRKYGVSADLHLYALYIVWGDRERCMGPEERPLVVFKELEARGPKPMFMLRKLGVPNRPDLTAEPSKPAVTKIHNEPSPAWI